MTEKEIKLNFASHHLEDFKEYLQTPLLRLYAIELPIENESNEKYFIDMILLNNKEVENYSKQMFVLEFKKDKINYGPVDQLNLYVNLVHKKFYRRNKTLGILVAPGFAKYELDQCKEYGFHALLLDNKFNMKFLT